jgi:hypothetical protein
MSEHYNTLTKGPHERTSSRIFNHTTKEEDA